MAKIRKKELNQMSKELLKNTLDELSKELFKLNAKRAIGTALESPGRIKQIKKTIARIHTIQNKNIKEVNKVR